MLLYFYKIFRLIIIAIIITYFIGCFWFLLSTTLTEALEKNQGQDKENNEFNEFDMNYDSESSHS